MGKDNLIKDKSFEFATEVVKLYKKLTEERQEYVLSKQLLCSGTSIGANVREALNTESKKDFVHMLFISQKEADETTNWLELQKKQSILIPQIQKSILKKSLQC